MKFTVYMEPVAKARARTVIRKGKIHSFTPRETELAEWKIQQAIPQNCLALSQYTPVKLQVAAYLPKPKSLLKKRTAPVTRPDFDNYAKLIADALSEFVYYDDAQITTAIIRKRYGTPPRIEIDVTEDDLSET